MPTKFFFPVLLLLFKGFSGLCQSFTAESGDLYMTDDPLKYSCSVTVLSGVLKKTDKIDFYAPKGTKYTAIILEMTQDYQPVNEIKSGQYGSIVVKFSQSFSGSKDYPTYKSKILPSGSSGVSAPSTTEEKSAPHFTAMLDGKAWRGKITYKGALLGRKGFSPLNIKKPCLQLQFGSTIPSDERSLTIQIFYPKESPAKYTAKDMEVNFSGSAGEHDKSPAIYGFVNGKSQPDFTLEIQEWKSLGNNKAQISGTISGELPEVMLLGKSGRKVRFENGRFQNVEVEIINE